MADALVIVPTYNERSNVDRLPYHHDWEPAFTAAHGLRVLWFGRWGDPDWSIEPSRLAADLVCFFYLLDGACTAAVNGAPVPMRPGELVVLRGAEVFSFSQDPSRPQTSLSACLALDVGTEANALLNLGYRRHYRLSDPKAYERRFAAVLDALAGRGRWRDLHVTASLFAWLAELQEALQPEPRAAADPRTVHHILAAEEWARERLGEDVTVLAWAAACKLNADYFSRLFKAHTGLSAKAWLLEARLQRGAQLLADTDAKVADVAERCGFHCPFHFSRTFKRRFDMPPAGYRRIRHIRGFQ